MDLGLMGAKQPHGIELMDIVDHKATESVHSAYSHVEPELHYVPVLDHIILPFDA